MGFNISEKYTGIKSLFTFRAFYDKLTFPQRVRMISFSLILNKFMIYRSPYMINQEQLIKKAFEAQKFSYAPYSQFNVGAALLCADGTIYTGCNIENAAFSPTNCAERTAFFKAISEGQKDFVAIAIVGNKSNVKKGQGDYCAPCAVCRQVMAEFCDLEKFQVIMAKDDNDYIENTLGELIPLAFTGKDLNS